MAEAFRCRRRHCRTASINKNASPGWPDINVKAKLFYHPEVDGGISILDQSLGIDWRIPTDHAILSEKDTKHPLLKDFDSPFVL